MNALSSMFTRIDRHMSSRQCQQMIDRFRVLPRVAQLAGVSSGPSAHRMDSERAMLDATASVR